MTSACPLISFFCSFACKTIDQILKRIFMKPFFLLLIATIATVFSFAQKAGKAPVTGIVVATTYTCPMHPDVVSDKPGKCPKCNMDLTASPKEKMKAEVTQTYTCPVHKSVVRDHAGVCPTCKAQLVVDRKGSKQLTKTYTCSMHPNVASAKPGKCPVCGMALQEAKTTEKNN